MTVPGHDILTSIAVSIVAAAGVALLARRARQPLILGYVLGGALLGPHIGVGLVTDEASIELIAEMGLILLLFIIGLEISVPALAQAGRTIAVSGLLQFPLCAALTWWALGSLAESSGGRFDRLYLAVTLGLSSTLIVVKILADKVEMSTFAGRLTLGILIFQDLWAIAFLALQPSLDALAPARLLGSAATGVGLVASAAVLSRLVLPRLFRWIAPSPELTLLTTMAWCFVVAGTAGRLGLSYEMGALIAGMVIGAFPYGTEVVSRLSGVRDFFVTLFFVSLGLKIPAPSPRLLLVAVGVAAFVVVSRFAVVYPMAAALRLDLRTAGVVSVNLAQISEFSLVIVSLGAAHGHVSDELAALVLYTLLVTSVVATYAIRANHEIASVIARVLGATGLPHTLGRRRAPPGSDAAPPPRDIFFLGVSHEGFELLRRLERESPDTRRRVVAVDFNPETLERLQASGIECHYGDISNAETLRHAGIERARLVVSSIFDHFLQGTDNRRLLRQVRALAPSASVVVVAETAARAQELYAEGADYVLVPPVLTAEHLTRLLVNATAASLAEARRQQARALDGVGAAS
jgi:Kef-type K+ transport system membrane component KefB/Trk K+ transport system NAD-binding subunit